MKWEKVTLDKLFLAENQSIDREMIHRYSVESILLSRLLILKMQPST